MSSSPRAVGAQAVSTMLTSLSRVDILTAMSSGEAVAIGALVRDRVARCAARQPPLHSRDIEGMAPLELNVDVVMAKDRRDVLPRIEENYDAACLANDTHEVLNRRSHYAQAALVNPGQFAALVDALKRQDAPQHEIDKVVVFALTMSKHPTMNVAGQRAQFSYKEISAACERNGYSPRATALVADYFVADPQFNDVVALARKNPAMFHPFECAGDYYLVGAKMAERDAHGAPSAEGALLLKQIIAATPVSAADLPDPIVEAGRGGNIKQAVRKHVAKVLEDRFFNARPYLRIAASNSMRALVATVEKLGCSQEVYAAIANQKGPLSLAALKGADRMTHDRLEPTPAAMSL